jgi:hypothetical protein
MKKRRKAGAGGDELAQFQARLLELLWQGGEPRAIRRALLADPELAPFHAYIRTMEPRMIAVAAELARKWGKLR